jgi:hypothetical protein
VELLFSYLLVSGSIHCQDRLATRASYLETQGYEEQMIQSQNENRNTFPNHTKTRNVAQVHWGLESMQNPPCRIFIYHLLYIIGFGEQY